MAFYDTEQILNYLHHLLDSNKGELGLEYVGYGDEQLLPRYPVAVVLPGSIQRELHATRHFRVVWNMEIYVYHAAADIGRARRTEEDLELVSRVRALIHSNMRFVVDGVPQITHGWIDSESPGLLSSAKGDIVVGTRITWRGEGIQPFDLP